MNQILLNQLKPFGNKRMMLVHNQNTGDIINGILKTHDKYASDYDKISDQFNASTHYEIGRKLWNYIKDHIKYKVEPDHYQTLKSPAAIIATGNTTGSDCKNYALFIGGVLSSLNRKGKKINWVYRFASYKMFDTIPQHVFVVINPDTDNEIWIDPVLDQYDYHKPYYSKIDKRKMALYQISGIGKAKREKKGILKKVGKVVLKFAAAPARNAFLLLVKINFRNLAKNLDKALQKNADKVNRFWQSAGGDTNALLKQINIGKTKKRILGVGVVPAAAAPATVAAATPILVKIATLLKEIGIDPNKVADAALTMAKEKAEQAIEKIDQKNMDQELQTAELISKETDIPLKEVKKINDIPAGKTDYKKYLIPAAIGVGAILLITSR